MKEITTRRPGLLSPLALTAAGFLLGSLLGTALGCLSTVFEIMPAAISVTEVKFRLAEFLLTYVQFAFFSALAFLFGTSLIGRRIIPFFSVFRGICLSCGAIFLLRTGTEQKTALIQIGFPALFSVPAFFLIAEDGILSSDIIRLCTGSGLIRSCENVNFRRVAAVILLLALAAAAKVFWIPLIL